MTHNFKNMKKVITYKGYTYYIGQDNGNPFYNIVPKDQKAPNGGYAREYILHIKHTPDLFDITTYEINMLKKVKNELLNDSNATFDSQSRNNKYLLDMATKYKLTTQQVFELI